MAPLFSVVSKRDAFDPEVGCLIILVCGVHTPIKRFTKSSAFVIPFFAYLKLPSIRRAKVLFIMCDLNVQNRNGDTPLQYGLQGTEMGMDTLEFLLRKGTSVYIRNFKGRSVIHDAVKYSHLGISAVDLLLEYGASINAVDNQGATVLHDALKNPRVNLTIIKKLLEYGARPDSRDDENCPPLAYCELSNLRPAEKESVENLLIQYTVINKLDNHKCEQLERESGLVEGDEILCLHFCKDITKRNEWATFRDSCIAEVTRMAKLSVGNNSLLKLIVNLCYKRTDKDIDISLVKEVWLKLANNEYPVFKDIIIAACKKCGSDVLED